MIYLVIALNSVLGVIISAAYYPVLGIINAILNLLLIFVLYDTSLGQFFIGAQMRHWGGNVNKNLFQEKRFLMSVACLSFSLKVSAAITLFVEVGAIALLAFCILGASGFFFEGYESGMTVSGSVGIAKLVVKVFSFVNITFDKIAEWIAKLELRILNIELE